MRRRPPGGEANEPSRLSRGRVESGGGREMMAHVARRFVKAHCPDCRDEREFDVLETWRIRCPVCGYERSLRARIQRRREVALIR
jgi:hypothetical protein